MTIDPDNFFSFESDLSLFDIRIADIPIWERIRFPVWRAINEQIGASQAHTHVDHNIRSYISGTVSFLKNIVYKNPLLSGSQDLLFVGHERRKKESDGYWWDIYCDPIHESTDYEYVHLEFSYLLDHLTPAKTERLRYLDLIQFGGTIQRKLGLKGPPIPSDIEDQLRNAETEIERRFGAQVDVVEFIRSILDRRMSTLWLYRRLLRRIDPEIVILTVSYGKEDLIEACKERKTPVVELQHGGFGPDHPGYSYPGDRTKETFPDYLFTFGDFWKERVEFPISNDRVYSVGYPYLERQRRRYRSIDTDDSVLFISQGPVGEELTKFAVTYAEIEDTYDVIVKLHPGEYDRWRETYPWLVDAPLTVIDGDDPPLYELLARNSVQVGVDSTVIYEGLTFGNETYLLKDFKPMRTEHLVEEGRASFVSSSTDLYEYVRTSQESPAIEVTHYFESDPIENIRTAIDEIR